MDDTPASRAGVEAGDYITHIDGEPIMGLTLSEAVEKMRGQLERKLSLRLSVSPKMNRLMSQLLEIP